MWAGSVLLRVGAARDLLVALNVDSLSALDRVRTLFESWLEPDPTLAVAIQPAFGLVVGNSDGRRRTGLRSVPQLRHGATVVMRSREPDDVLRALAQVLGGAHACRRDDGRTWVSLRPFVRGDGVVLVDATRPALVNDPQLARGGVAELSAWSVVVEPDGSVDVPPPLSDIAWTTVGVEPPLGKWLRLQLTGIAVLQHDDCTLAEVVADLALRSTGAAWFSTVAAAAHDGRVLRCAHRPSMRTAIDGLLK